MPKIPDLAADTSVASTDLLIFEDLSEGTTEKITFADLMASIPTNTLQASMFANNAIKLGSDTLTSSPSSITSNTAVAIGLSSTVTIPAGGRDVKISVFIPNIRNNNASGGTGISIWDGTVGSGTQLQEAEYGQAQTASNRHAPSLFAIVSAPTAGAKTYNVGWRRLNSTGTSAASLTSTTPAIIIVEAI